MLVICVRYCLLGFWLIVLGAAMICCRCLCFVYFVLLILHVLLLWFELSDLVCGLGVVGLICCFVLFVVCAFWLGCLIVAFGCCFGVCWLVCVGGVVRV